MDTNTIKTTGVVIFNSEKTEVLLVEHLAKAEHFSNTYGIPAGRLEENQTLEENAVRELKEETGLVAIQSNLIKLPFEYEADIARKDGSTKHFHLVTFLCNKYSGELMGNYENKPVWKKVTELEYLTLLPNMKKVINDALSYM